MRQARTLFLVPFATTASVVFTVALCAFALASASASAAPSLQASAAAGGQQTAAVGPPVEGGIIDQILVKVNGVAILHSEFEANWADQLANVRGQLPEEEILAQWHELRLFLLGGMIDGLMYEQRAEQIGITADPNEIDRAMVRVREQQGFISDDLWQEALAQSGLTEAAFREQIGKRIVQQRLIFSEIQGQVFVAEREIAAYYEENVASFTAPAQVAFQQLIFRFTADREADRTRADAALAKLRGGVSLSAVGAEYEQHLAFVQGADAVSYIEESDLREEIAAALAELTPLTYSDLIETPFGYAILQLMDRRDETVKTLDEARDEIGMILENQKANERMAEYAKQLRERAFLEVFSEEFADIESVWAAELTQPTQER